MKKKVVFSDDEIDKMYEFLRDDEYSMVMDDTGDEGDAEYASDEVREWDLTKVMNEMLERFDTEKGIKKFLKTY